MGCTAGTTSNAHAVEDIDVFTAEADPKWHKSGSATFSDVSSTGESGYAQSGCYSSEDSNATSRRGVQVGTTMRERRERQIMLKNARWQRERALREGVVTAEGESRWQKSGSATFSEVSSAAESSDGASGCYSSEDGKVAFSRGTKVGTTAKERRERQIMLRNKRLLNH